METDYNAIVHTITDAQRRGDEYPAKDKPQVMVDQFGVIEVSRREPTDPALSHVQHGTFAASMTGQRYQRDLATAKRKLPPGTYYEPTRGVEGWYYSVVTTDFRTKYVFCAYFDGVDYKVRLIQPVLENDPRVARARRSPLFKRPDMPEQSQWIRAAHARNGILEVRAVGPRCRFCPERN